jgi:hypothetical protein
MNPGAWASAVGTPDGPPRMARVASAVLVGFDSALFAASHIVPAFVAGVWLGARRRRSLLGDKAASSSTWQADKRHGPKSVDGKETETQLA